jgi:hypothetical protein
MPIRPDRKCLEEAFTSRKVFVSYAKTFGYIVYTDIPKEVRGKLELIARKTIFIGYLLILKQYKLYDLATREVIVSTALRFTKDEF